MTASPLAHLSQNFAALFGGELHGGRLIQPATTVTDDAGGLARHHADGVAADEQQHNDVS